MSKVKSGSKETDFYKLRILYTDTAEYAPYSNTDRPKINDAFEMLSKQQYEKCLSVSENVLQRNYVNLWAHYLSIACNFELERHEQGRFHQFVLNGLMDSIGHSGNGRAPESAFTTISTSELKAFLQLGGLEVIRQSLISENGKPYDLMRVKNPKTEDEFDLYFDISIQMSKGFGFLEK